MPRLRSETRSDDSPSEARPKRCRPCATAHVCLPSRIVERWIEARREGQSWCSIATDDGRSQPAIKRAVYLYLRRNDRLDEIPLIWGPGERSRGSRDGQVERPPAAREQSAFLNLGSVSCGRDQSPRFERGAAIERNRLGIRPVPNCQWQPPPSRRTSYPLSRCGDAAEL